MWRAPALHQWKQMLRGHDYREEPFGSIGLWRFLQGTPSEYLLNWTGTKAESQCQDSKRMVGGGTNRQPDESRH